MTFDQLTFKVHGTSSVASRDQILYDIWAKSSKPWLNYWSLSDFLHTLCYAETLAFDLLTFNFYSPSGVMRLNSVQNMSEIDGWVIDDLARLHRAILGVGYNCAGPLHQTFVLFADSYWWCFTVFPLVLCLYYV